MSDSAKDDWSIAYGLFILQVSIGLCILFRGVIVFVLKSIVRLDRSLRTGHFEEDDGVAELKCYMNSMRKRVSRRRTLTTTSSSNGSSKRPAEGDEEKGRTLGRERMDFYKLTQLVCTKGKDHVISLDIPHTPRIEKAAVTSFRNSLLQSVFVGHLRREKNFILSNVHPELKLPPR